MIAFDEVRFGVQRKSLAGLRFSRSVVISGTTTPPPGLGLSVSARADIDTTPSPVAHELAMEIAALIGRETVSPLLNAREAATILNVPASWIAAEARAGRVPHVRLGRYVRFSRDELMRWCEGRSVGPRARRGGSA